MIKICFVSPGSYTYFFDDKETTSGGAEYQMFLLAELLSENESLSIDFLLEKIPDKVNVYKTIRLHKSFMLRKGNSFSKKWSIARKYFGALYRLRPDIVITTTANPIVGMTAFYKRILRFKHIHRTAHLFDVDGTWIASAGFPGKIYRYGLINADLIITQTHEHHELLKKVHLLQSEVLPNGIEIKTPTAIEKHGVLWVGRYENWKRPETVIEIAKSLPEIAFTMICPPPKQLSKDYDHLKIALKQIPNIQFIEKVPFKDIHAYFEKTAIFINTSDKEGFPNTFLQAAQAKTPVLSLKVDPDRYLEKYKCGTSCNGDRELLVNTLNNWMNNPNLREEYGQNHYSYLKEFHDCQIVSRKLEALIKQIVHES
jgi:glycosyltransferase involved in cell wall biosynthesis